MRERRIFLAAAGGMAAFLALAIALVFLATRPPADERHEGSTPVPVTVPAEPPAQDVATAEVGLEPDAPVAPVTVPVPVAVPAAAAEARPLDVVWPPESEGAAVIPVPSDPEQKIQALVTVRDRRKAALIARLNQRGR